MDASYTPKNILITGAAGFVASHVTNRLVRNHPDYKIVALDKLDYCSNLKNLDPSWSSPNFKFIKGDISSSHLVNSILRTTLIDTILHFAAQTHVDNSFFNSFEFVKNNIYGTHALLEACKHINAKQPQVRRFIHVSTDEVYGTTNENALKGVDEASQLRPTNAYAATKAGAEMLAMAYERSYGLPVIVTRGNNVYGPHQYPEKLIPKFILQAMRGMPLTIHGDGSNLRSYLYIDDIVDAFEVILHEGNVGDVYNIGTEDQRSVIEVARDICEHFSLDPDVAVKFVEDRPFNDKRYLIDVQKLRKFGWHPKTTWEEGLESTIAWYTINPNWWGDISHTLLPHSKMRALPNVISSSHSLQFQQGRPLKFLIFGKTGWIGGLLGKICQKEGIPFEYGKGRLEERSQLLEDIHNVKPTHVLNAAGITGTQHADWCEFYPVETIRANVIGTLTLADICREYGILMMNYTSGCIFDYDDAHPLGSGIGFKEEDKSNYSGSFLSKGKAMVEELLRRYENVCSLRMRMPASSDLGHPRNLINKLTRYEKVINIPNSMTVLDELLPISIEMTKRNYTGIWNLTNPGTISHNEILEMYKEYVNPNFKWVNFTLEEQAKVLVAPRCNCELDATKLKEEFPKLLPVKESLIKYVFEPNKAASAGVVKTKKVKSSF